MKARERRALLAYAKARRAGRLPAGLAWEIIHGITDWPYHPCSPARGQAMQWEVCAEVAESIAYDGMAVK